MAGDRFVNEQARFHLPTNIVVSRANPPLPEHSHTNLTSAQLCRGCHTTIIEFFRFMMQSARDGEHEGHRVAMIDYHHTSFEAQWCSLS